VRRGEGGRVTLWPVNALGPEVKRPPLPRSDGVVGYAAELVDVPPEVRLVVDRALGDTLVVEDRETALRLRREECWLPLVTVDGERFVDGSHQVAGSGEALGLVARQVEIHRLKEEIEGDRSALDAESLAREAAAQERARLAAERERLETEHSGVQEALSRAAREHEVAKAALDEARARRAREGNSAAALQEACAQVRDRILRQETLVADGIRCAQERREEAASLVERLGGMETTSRALQEETARFREGAARLRERSGSLGEQRRTYREAASLLHSQREAASERACALDRQVGEVRDEQASLVQASEEAARRQVEARERAEAASSAHDALQQDHAASRASLQATERSSREAERALDAARGDLDRAEAKRGEWIAEHRREWGIDLEAEGAPAGEEVRSEEDLEGLLRAARGALEKMGSVNLEAISEQEELETRVSFLDMQLKDLTEAKRALGDLIARMNELSRERFAKTFTDVQEHFGGMFRKLFGGGKAELRLEEGVDLLDAGVEILARPPGKELMPISLLSGGEKALTAVSLLFGVFRSRPSPFCILDEVDAPLDESNIDRFLGVLKGFLDRSQFLIITHKKRTMRMADTLYGITQQEPGVSRWISLKFEDVAPSVSS
ncbi:MAG: hypothetical protein HY608_05605, partial [Planctomycetes bacterium]|nr:hypothetical protein [Planctomycetota bacterium]